MYINEAERTVLGKLCYYGANNAGIAELLSALHDHFAAIDGARTHLDSKRFLPRAELELTMSAKAATEFMSAAEKAFDAPYAELTASGTLVWLRAPLVGERGPRSYARSVDVFCATGDATSDALRTYSLTKADALVFVADPADKDATMQAWSDLRATDYRGPIVLLANRAASPDELVEWLSYEGPAFAEPEGFSGNHDAFETASTLALRRFTSAN